MFISHLRKRAREKVAEQIAAIPLNAAAYQDLKDGHPGKVAGVLTGDHVMFYGEDARTAAQALGTKVLDADVPGLGQTETTGSNLSWQFVLKKLMDHNIPVVLAQQDPERGVDTPYLVVKERDTPLPVEELAAQIYDLASKVNPELTNGSDREQQVNLTIDYLRKGDTEDIQNMLAGISMGDNPEYSSQANKLLEQIPDPAREQEGLER